MIHNATDSFFLRLTGVLLGFAVFGLFSVSLGTEANAQGQKAARAFSEPAATQQPSYSDYKGVRIGMSTEEARAKLGAPTREFDGQDLYVVSETETVQIYYDTSRKVTAISIDYLGDKGGAPDYKAIVGAKIQTRQDGSLYKFVRYEQLGFWVSFNRTVGELGVTTVTIQKIP